MREKTYYQRNREVILNGTKDYYENNKELLRERGKNKYRESSEEKNLKRECGKKRYHNMSEEKKQKLKEYQKIIVRLRNMFHKCKYVNKSLITESNINNKHLYEAFSLDTFLP